MTSQGDSSPHAHQGHEAHTSTTITLARAKSKRAWANQLAKREGISPRQIAQAQDEAHEAELLAKLLNEQGAAKK